jgi:HAD superfamily hydrolase (TIGR01549 family)
MQEERKVTIFFDIGHTLAVGGEMSPRRLIGHRLRLSESDMKSLGKFIMTTPIETVEELVVAVEPFTRHLSASSVWETVREVWEEQEYCVELIPGVEDVIKSLAAKGYDLGVISNIWHPFYQGVRKKAGDLWSHFKYELLSYRVGFKKPDVRIYQRAYEMSQPGEIWMVGDSYEMDISPAKTRGFRTIWFLIRPERERETVAMVLRGDLSAPDFAVSDLRELVGKKTPFRDLH